MIQKDLIARGVKDSRVLDAMRNVHREDFLADRFKGRAYDDSPLEIGWGQTISQPYIVAKMTELLDLSGREKILEIGAGCGYQTAILMELGAFVYAVEIVTSLGEALEERLRAQSYTRFKVSCRDGRAGWPDHAPYDRILVAAAPRALPEALMRQVSPGGRILAPIGGGEEQMLTQWDLGTGGWVDKTLFPVRFVPMTGQDAPNT